MFQGTGKVIITESVPSNISYKFFKTSTKTSTKAKFHTLIPNAKRDDSSEPASKMRYSCLRGYTDYLKLSLLALGSCETTVHSFCRRSSRSLMLKGKRKLRHKRSIK